MSTISLEDEERIEAFARTNGCTLAQAKHAIETVGPDESLIRKYLLKHGRIAEKNFSERVDGMFR